MGDLSDMNDIDRVTRSPEGMERLEGIRETLVGRTVTGVEFGNEIHAISILLRLDNGDTFLVMDPSLDVDALREEFADVIRREYLVDYPERRTDADGANHRPENSGRCAPAATSADEATNGARPCRVAGRWHRSGGARWPCWPPGDATPGNCR
jgi:hypothetical protein